MLFQFPNPDTMLAGFLAQAALAGIITGATSGDYWGVNAGIFWFLLIGLSALLAILTYIKNKGEDKKLVQGPVIVSFIGSFILNLSGDSLGMYAVASQASYKIYNIYILYCTIPIMGLASLLIAMHYLKETNPQASEENTKLPNPEIILFGICIQCVIGKCMFAIEFESFCGLSF